MYSSTAKKTFFCCSSVLLCRMHNVFETSGSGIKSRVLLLVLSFITSEMEHELYGTKALVRTEMFWEKVICLISDGHLQVYSFSSFVCFLLLS